MESPITLPKLRHADLAPLSLTEVRRAMRENRYAGPTAGLCDGRLQCNMVILPASYGAAFQKFCEENPVFCPLLGVSEPGQPHLPALGAEIDLRHDLPLFFVYRPGQTVERRQDISALWRDDFQAFAIGCSFTFEHALMREGIGMRHIEEDVTVPMYRTDIATVPSGVFSGPAVVSMRPVREDQVERVAEICRQFPHAHGAPIHAGDPASIGIQDVMRPDWGDAVSLKPGEVPVFWGCGVTSQMAVTQAAPEIAITHAPGAMLITDADEIAPPGWGRAAQ